jgi:hypothetical protein
VNKLTVTAALLALGLGTPAFASVSVLFDNTKAEQAGNADWVVDSDSGVAAATPTPAASGIKSNTAETYWTGALSSWGIDLVKAGDTVQTLPTTGRITYGDSTNAQDLSHYSVYVIDEPNVLFTTAEKTAILNFVSHGGGLFMISDHVGSDRNNDGADSVQVWNDLLTNNGIKSNPFGISYNTSSPDDVTINSSYVDTSTADPLIHGPNGTVATIDYDDGDTMALSTAANSSVKAAVWYTSAHSSSTVLAAYATYGLGRVVAVGDSSPEDDGTGASGNTLYDGWDADSDAAFFLNGTTYLAGATTVPEPASIGLLVAGAVGLLVRRKR